MNVLKSILFFRPFLRICLRVVYVSEWRAELVGKVMDSLRLIVHTSNIINLARLEGLLLSSDNFEFN